MITNPTALNPWSQKFGMDASETKGRINPVSASLLGRWKLKKVGNREFVTVGVVWGEDAGHRENRRGGTLRNGSRSAAKAIKFGFDEDGWGKRRIATLIQGRRTPALPSIETIV